MISERIDLTLNRDFRERGIPLDNLIIPLGIRHTLIEDWYDEINMTPVEYEYICRFERIFGRLRKAGHRNEKDKAFGKDVAYENELRTHCHKCGRELRIPWKSFYNLCYECNEKLLHEYNGIPWKRSLVSDDVGERRYSIFDLR